jgi:rod shape-determining protein MreC
MAKAYLRKKEGKFRGAIIVILVFVLIVFLLNLFPGKTRPFFYWFSSPIQTTFWQWGDDCSDFFSGVFRGAKLEKEKEILETENQKLISEIIGLKALKEENRFLREAINAGLEKEFNVVFSRIISKDYSEDILLINKGEEEGVKEGMPAITPEKALAGRVTEVYKNFSKVEIISNDNFAFDVKVLDKEITALAKGEGNSKFFLDLIPKESEIAVGDIIVTAGLEESIPSGLLVGRVREVYEEDTESMQRAAVDPEFSLDRNFHLFIIKSR